tara:strand:- start:61 stop:789 length:729 start_codon:yes stop_codon:yes gene_type:complete
MDLNNFSIYNGTNITSHDMNYDYIIDNLDQSVVSQCNTESDNVSGIIDIKNKLIDILNSVPLNKEEVEEVKSDKLIKLNDLYDEFKSDYLKEQDKYFQSERELNNAIIESKSNVKKLNVVIDFMRELNINDCKDQLQETIIENIKQYSNNIGGGNDHIKLMKENYIESRKNINKYLDTIKKLNHMNVSNSCPVCLTNPVNIYLNPCGHTLCDGCYDRVSMDNEKKCFLCRTRVLSKFPLYFS